MIIKSLPSPNFDDRPSGMMVDMVILHYTGMQDALSALHRLTDPASQVSAHYTIDEDGTIYHHVPEEKRAWHAGVAFWRGDRAINARSIGVELVNPGHEFGYRIFPAKQIDGLIGLLANIRSRHTIPPQHYLAHSDVAPTRKEDPGELFPWQLLAEHGFGIWPDHTIPEVQPLGSIYQYLMEIGYELVDHDASLQAFCRHWVPEYFTQAGQCDMMIIQQRLSWIRDRFRENCQNG